MLENVKMNMEPEKHVQEIMNSLEGMQKAKSPTNGFVKIQQKLANQRLGQSSIKQDSSQDWIKIAAVIMLLITSNIWAVSNYLVVSNSSSLTTQSYPQITTDFNLYKNE